MDTSDTLIVPTLRVGMQLQTLCVAIGMRVFSGKDAERPQRLSHAERGNDICRLWRFLA